MVYDDDADAAMTIRVFSVAYKCLYNTHTYRESAFDILVLGRVEGRVAGEGVVVVGRTVCGHQMIIRVSLPCKSSNKIEKKEK